MKLLANAALLLLALLPSACAEDRQHFTNRARVTLSGFKPSTAAMTEQQAEYFADTFIEAFTATHDMGHMSFSGISVKDESVSAIGRLLRGYVYEVYELDVEIETYCAACSSDAWDRILSGSWKSKPDHAHFEAVLLQKLEEGGSPDFRNLGFSNVIFGA